LMLSHLSILAPIFWAIGVLFRKSSSNPVSSSVLPMFSYSTFKVSDLILRLGFCTGWEIETKLQFFTCEYSVFQAPFVEESVFSPMCVLACLWKLRLYLCGFISASSSSLV
jgi:hypothetical protein